jgi:hypothetical protein
MNLFPSLDCRIPTGTDNKKNQRNTAEGISWASVALRCISELTLSTPIPTRSQKLMTKNAIRTGSILEILIFVFIFLVFVLWFVLVFFLTDD